MGTTEVYLAAVGDMGTTNHTSDTTSGAMDYFLGTVAINASKYVTIAGDSAGGSTVTLALMRQVWDTDMGDGNTTKWALPSPGNHDALDPSGGAVDDFYSGWFDYWKENEVTGMHRPTDMGMTANGTTNVQKGRFWYSKDLFAPDGNSYWKAIVLNGELYQSVGTHTATDVADQLAALDSYIAAANSHTPKQHLVVMWHRPLFTVTPANQGIAVKAFWTRLADYTGGMKIVINGHWHYYARFKPCVWNGANDLAADSSHGMTLKTDVEFGQGIGIIQCIVGLGGQNPGGEGSAPYWNGIATYQTNNPRPTGAGGSANKAFVIGPPGNSGQLPDNTTDADGQPGHPYGITGLTLDYDRAKIAFYGNVADPGVTPNVKTFEGPATFVFDTGSPPPPPPPPGLTALAIVDAPIGALVKVSDTSRTRSVTVNASSSTGVRSSLGYKFAWGDGQTTAYQTSPIAQHTYEHNLGTAAYKHGLGRSWITVTVRDDAGTEASTRIKVLNLSDHVMTGGYAEKGGNNLDSAETYFGRILDVEMLVSTPSSTAMPLAAFPSQDEKDSIARNSGTTFPRRTRIPMRAIEFAGNREL